MKLSKRLAAIDALITEPEDIIWDCCCDHGYLGLALLKRNAANKVVFVDIVATLMNDLEAQLSSINKLQKTGDKNSQWQVLCQDVGKIEIAQSKSQVVVIAGVGGELLLRLIQQITVNNLSEHLNNVRFILCPVHHTYKLRVGLKQLGLGLISEQIIYDNKRFYEVIEVSFNTNNEISNTGNEMWDFTSAEHAMYQRQLINHYNKMLNKDALYYQKVIKNYQELTDS
ncbi:tRNA (adenine(22)-N(1))-methyltransferase TrmK [Pseudoalteromonas sp. SG45-5]|uniref:tRNA (adenine(22)-N(1))-methyltransferase n=1 Tax=Pseudoalteromonas TaxID=53246 RepID=UPI0015F90F04|nr:MULTISPECIES: tRNA (adenine(22)-N(1))-methyltransferase TrmK [Pseudoalteromonas]MBB1385311.1 tRNA (adenine(22)-N(1))-methyltransferase TrmK [Pseudoalteromonas sp. SG45-5]MBB1394842.1 tRNA (adenine(22)-N(1))-methyltransferase TrmK [Pseudoalteromonas sp. SG44-4]MBB1448292.1 tRNA (adenine(22)-N(1))-methyltransferase TrmK [Pseudoalteromonas sp. SG41-6]